MPLTLTFLVLIIIFVYSGYQIRQTTMVHAVEHRYHGVKTLFGEMLQQRTDLMVSTLKFVTSQTPIADLMQNGDRENLYKLTRPLLEALYPGHAATHFYFHSPDGTNFLRVHSPEKYGDKIDRFTLIQSRASRKLSHGVELGVFGVFSLRVVLPWVYQGKLIGYVELAEDIEQVLKKLKNVTNTDFIISLDKKFLDQAMWEEGFRMSGKTPDWNFLTDKVIASQTIPSIPHSLEESLLWQYRADEHFHAETQVDEKSYQIKAFPLNDVQGTIVGDFVILLDTSKQQSEFYRFMHKIIILSLLLCSALFAFAYKILGRVDRDLVGTREQLFGQIENASQINALLEKENLERRNAEENLRQLNNELERRVTARTQELEHAYDDLRSKQITILHQDKMAGLGQLAAGVAHDINNPIGFVANNLSELSSYTKDLCRFIEEQGQALESSDPDTDIIEALSERRRDLKVDEIIEDLDDILKESLEGTERVSKIVQNLRSFSRLDEDDFEMADLEDCLDSTINITANELRYKAEVVRNYAQIPPLKCFPGQLNQVFMNLLINAAQSMQDYGTVTVSTWEEGGSACISVADTGSGITEEIRERIFEPFFTTKPVGSGTGLGLSIAYDIIKKHEGTMHVESAEGQGTSFVIKLPYQRKLES